MIFFFHTLESSEGFLTFPLFLVLDISTSDRSTRKATVLSRPSSVLSVFVDLLDIDLMISSRKRLLDKHLRDLAFPPGRRCAP